MAVTLHTAAERPDLWKRGVASEDVFRKMSGSDSTQCTARCSAALSGRGSYQL